MSVQAKEGYLRIAEIARDAGFASVMIKGIILAAETGVAFNETERQQLEIAFRIITEPRRRSWKDILKIENRVRHSRRQVEIVQEYKDIVETEIKLICYELVRLIDLYLLPMAASIDSQVFYYRLKADYVRYLTEVSRGFDRIVMASRALQLYQEGFALSLELPIVHVDRLQMVLSYSYFYYDIVGSVDKSYNLVKETLDTTKAVLLSRGLFLFNRCLSVVQALRRNLREYLFLKQKEDIRASCSVFCNPVTN